MTDFELFNVLFGSILGCIKDLFAGRPRLFEYEYGFGEPDQ